jgi:O-acetylhomoserine/O-acetylserine sulfhydrylase-like pyridoxal-dependent enzyme
MAWSATYTSEARVKGRVKNIDIEMTSAQIGYAIQDAEGAIEAAMRNNSFTFDAEKHMVIQQVATDLAAYYVILYNPTTFVLREKVSLMVDMLWASAMRGLAMLMDDRVVKYLTEL